MSPIVSEEPEFIVVGRLQSLVEQQDSMRTELQTLKSRLGSLEIWMTSNLPWSPSDWQYGPSDSQGRIANWKDCEVEREAHINMHMRRVILSFAAAVTPIILSVMLGQHIPMEQTPLIDFVNALSNILLAFAACVGLPLLVQSLSELHDAQTCSRPPIIGHPRSAPSRASGDDMNQEPEDSRDEEDSSEDENTY